MKRTTKSTTNLQKKSKVDKKLEAKKNKGVGAKRPRPNESWAWLQAAQNTMWNAHMTQTESRQNTSEKPAEHKVEIP